MTGIAATVRSHDAGTGSGTLLLDDGSLLTYSADAFEAGGLRLLRSGQRVVVQLEPDDMAVLVVTLPGIDTS
jgi:hypothetical protein